MKVSCQKCEARFKIDDSKIPEQGLTLNCPKCKSPITVQKGTIGSEIDTSAIKEEIPQAAEVPPKEAEVAAPPAPADEMDDFLDSFDADLASGEDATEVDLPPESIALPAPESAEPAPKTEPEDDFGELDFAEDFAVDDFDGDFGFDEAETEADPVLTEADPSSQLNDDFSLDDALADIDDDLEMDQQDSLPAKPEQPAVEPENTELPETLDSMFDETPADFDFSTNEVEDEFSLDMPSMLENAALEMEESSAAAEPEAENFADQGFSFDDMIGGDDVPLDRPAEDDIPPLEMEDQTASTGAAKSGGDIFADLPSIGDGQEKVALYHVKRHNGKVFGPFPVSTITEMIGEGKLQGTEEVSTDSKKWLPIGDVAEFSAFVEEAKSKGVLDTFLPEGTDNKKIATEKVKVKEESKIRRRAGSLDVVSPMKKRRFKLSAKVIVPFVIIILLAGAGAYLQLVEEIDLMDVISGKSISERALKEQLKHRYRSQYDKVELEIAKDNYPGFMNARKSLLNILKTPDFRGVGAMYSLLAQVDFQILRRYGVSSEISLEAETALKKVKELRKDELEVMIALATEKMYRRNYSKARDTYMKVVNLDPKNYKALHWLAESYLYMPDPKPAKKYLDNIVKDKKDTAATWYLNGKLQSLLDKPSEAKESFAKALEKDPQHLDTQIEMAGIRLQEPNGITRAERELGTIRNTFKEKLSRKQLAKVHYYFASIYDKRNEPYKIVKELMAAIDNELDNYLYYQMLGGFYLRRHEVVKADEQFKKCIQYNNMAIRCRLDLVKSMLFLDRADRALFKLEETQKLVPQNAEVFFLLGQTYEKLFKPKKALAMYEKAIKLDPNGVEYYTSAAMSYLKQDNLTKAGEYIQKAKLIKANSSLVFNFLGQMHQYQGDVEKAETEFKKAIEADNKNVDSHFHLANIYRESKRYNEATRQFEAVLDLDDKAADAYFGLGRTYYEMGENDKAISEFEKALNLTNRFANFYHFAGLAYYKKNDLEKAQAAFEKASDLEISDPEPVFYLARIHSEHKLYEESVEYFDKAVQLNDKKAEYFYHYGWLLEKQEKFSDALEMYDRALNLNNEYANVYLRKGISLRALNKYVPAIRNFKLAQKYNPDISMSLMELGECYFEMRKYKHAVKQFNKVLKLVPDSVNAYLKLGLVHQEMSKPKKAIKYLKKAIKLDNENPRIHLALGYTYKALRRKSKAIGEFKKYLELDPDAIDAEEVEAEIYYLKK